MLIFFLLNFKLNSINIIMIIILIIIVIIIIITIIINGINYDYYLTQINGKNWLRLKTSGTNIWNQINFDQILD